MDEPLYVVLVGNISLHHAVHNQPNRGIITHVIVGEQRRKPSNNTFERSENIGRIFKNLESHSCTAGCRGFPSRVVFGRGWAVDPRDAWKIVTSTFGTIIGSRRSGEN